MCSVPKGFRVLQNNRCGRLGKLLGVSGVVRLVRSRQLADAEYAHAASVGGSVGLVFTPAPARLTVRDAFGEHDAPSTLLGVAVLGYKDQLVEVEAIAAVRS